MFLFIMTAIGDGRLTFDRVIIILYFYAFKKSMLSFIYFYYTVCSAFAFIVQGKYYIAYGSTTHLLRPDGLKLDRFILCHFTFIYC